MKAAIMCLAFVCFGCGREDRMQSTAAAEMLAQHAQRASNPPRELRPLFDFSAIGGPSLYTGAAAQAHHQGFQHAWEKRIQAYAADIDWKPDPLEEFRIGATFPQDDGATEGRLLADEQVQSLRMRFDRRALKSVLNRVAAGLTTEKPKKAPEPSRL